jgi:hypothetical protein
VQGATPLFDVTPLSRVYASWRKYELDYQSPRDIQLHTLRSLVRRAQLTRFGREHDFAAITDLESFQERVRLRSYEQLWSEYWQPDFPELVDCTWPGLIPYFALTSGTTTGRTKYIPCTHDMLVSSLRAAHDVLVHHLLNRPLSRVLGGKLLWLGGSTNLTELAPGVRCGDLSGIEAWEAPWWERLWLFPPRDIALTSDWEDKIERMAAAAAQENIRSVSGAPNWTLLFFERLMAHNPGCDGIAGIFPDLELVVHGSINFAPYRRRFREMLRDTGAETREAYAASEGFIAAADRGDGEGLRLIPDAGIFFEFVPVGELDSANPTRHWLGDIEREVEYAVIISTCAGLWAYILGDTVRFVDRMPPRLLITGRTSYCLSVVGEHLIGEEIEEAVARAAADVGETVRDYSVASRVAQQAPGAWRHHYVVEFEGGLPGPGCVDTFGRRLDERLSRLNADYAAHRAGNFGLKPPKVEAVRPGTFASWMKKRGMLGGQHKVPRIIQDPSQFTDLMNFASLSGHGEGEEAPREC